jgi:hypothetical protein
MWLVPAIQQQNTTEYTIGRISSSLSQSNPRLPSSSVHGRDMPVQIGAPTLNVFLVPLTHGRRRSSREDADAATFAATAWHVDVKQKTERFEITPNSQFILLISAKY